jgi:glycosyltransferase involved in cell wall biosynthesis
MDPAPRYSVVVPVFNEAENIGPFCRKARAELPPGYELLVCYDFDGDSTLPALAALSVDEKPPTVRLVKNDLGRGVRYAIEAGMRAARAPVVVVMMADLSDDFAKVGPMVAEAEARADVVCASRYMRGGRQIGGPRLKGLMSRAAGLSLHWLAGLPTHDPTNSFKAYRKEFLDRTPIESKAGFCLGLELTAKAHFRGGRVTEVPAVWTDRAAGESRFQLRRWLPLYLRWYVWAFDQRYRRLFGGGLLGLVALLVFVCNFNPPVTCSPCLEGSWQYSLGYAARHHWRAGVDYVYTYGPLGFLTTVVYDPGLYPLRVGWEVGFTAVLAAVAVGLLRGVRPWPARLIPALLLTVLAVVLPSQDARCLFIMAGLTAALLYSARPSLLLAGAALSLLAAFALTKFTMLIAGAGVGAAILVHVAATRGLRPAAQLAAWGLSMFALLWVASGQALPDLPAFLRASLDQSNGYSEAMSMDGPKWQVWAALVGAGLVALAAGLRVPPGASWPARVLPAAAIGWLLFILFKGSFVRHHYVRAAFFFWAVALLPYLFWPTAAMIGRRRNALRATITAAVVLGLCGALTRPDPWYMPATLAETVRQKARALTNPRAEAARLEQLRAKARAQVDLPETRAAVGAATVDEVTHQPSVVMLNELNYAPRPSLQSFAAMSPTLQRRDRDYFCSPAAPEFILFADFTIDERLPTMDDGPAFLEIIRRYEPRETEKGMLLLRRRTDPGPDPVGPVLWEGDLRFGEPLDLAALGPGPKAISFGIEDSLLGRLRRFAFKPPMVGLDITFATGETVRYRIIPGMVRDPILIDPLPRTPGEFDQLLTDGLAPKVKCVRVVLNRPSLERYYAGQITCSIRAVQGLKTP